MKEPFTFKLNILNFFRILFVLVVLLSLLFILYIKINQHKVPEFISKQAQKQFGVSMGYNDFEFDPFVNFPKFTYKINCIYIDGSSINNFEHNFLEIEEVSFVLKPQELIAEEKHVEEIYIKNSHIHMYVDEEGNKNLGFLKTLADKAARTNEVNAEQNNAKIKLSKFNIENLHFEFKDDKMDKLYGVHFKKASVDPLKKDGLKYFIFDSDCHFDGLTFKKEDGPFLEHTDAKLHLNLCFKNDSILIQNSELNIQEDVLTLKGKLIQGETPYLSLNIASAGIELENATPLLPAKIQSNLEKFELDQLLYVSTNIEGYLKPYHPPKVTLDFSTYRALLKVEDRLFRNTTFTASFINDCFTKSDKILPTDACLQIHKIETELYPGQYLSASASLNDLEDFKSIDVRGEITSNLDKLSHDFSKNLGLNSLSGNAISTFKFKGNSEQLFEDKEYKNLNLSSNLKNVSFNYRGESFKKLNGLLIMDDASNFSFKDLDFVYKEMFFTMNGKAENINKSAKNKFKADLAIKSRAIYLENLMTSRIRRDEETLNSHVSIDDQLKDVFLSINEMLELNVKFDADQINYKGFNLSKSSFNFSNNNGDMRMSEFKSNVNGDNLLHFDVLFKEEENFRFEGQLNIEGSLDFVQDVYPNGKVNFEKGTFNLSADWNADLESINKLGQLEKLQEINAKIQLSNADFSLKEKGISIKELNANLNLDQNILSIESCNAKYHNVGFELEGDLIEINNYFQSDESKSIVDLKIQIPYINTNEFTATEENTNQNLVPSEVFRNLKNHWRKAEGKIKVNIDKLEHEEYALEDLNFRADINENCENSNYECLNISDIRTNVFGHIPFAAKARITNFSEPELELILESKMPIEDFSELLRDDNFEPKGGEVDFSMKYKQHISDLPFKEQIKNSDLRGKVKLYNVNLHYPYRGFDLYALDGEIIFDNKTIEVDELFMDLNKNPMILDGTCYDCIPFILNENVPFNLELDLSCSKLDFEKFYTPASIDKREGTKAEDRIDNSAHHGNNIIDRILTDGTMVLNTNIDSLVYYSFLAEEVIGFTYLDDQVVQLDHIEMKLGEGSFQINGAISDIEINQPNVEVEVYIQNLRTDSLLKAFDNFKQDKVTHKNLKGTMDADISFKSLFDKDYKVIKESIYGELQLELENGELKEFGPLKNLKGFLFKKRKLDNVYFDKLNTKLVIKGQDLHISKFDLNATAITLGIEGVYTFSDEDRTKIVMEIPISNLFKRHIDRKELLEHRKSRGGKRILIDLYEEDKKIKYRLHKLEKKDKKKKRFNWFRKQK